MGYLGKHKYLIIIMIVSIIGLLLLISIFTKRGVYTQTEFFMDTVVTIKLVKQPGAEEAINHTFAVMKDWSIKLDRFNCLSEITMVNNKAGKWVSLRPEFLDLLQKGKNYADLSKGAYDPTIAPLIDLWGFGSEKQHIPSQEELSNVLPKVDYKKIGFNFEHKLIYLPFGMKLDLGGMAKGFILDKGIETLNSLGIRSAYINAGGNIRVIGNKSLGCPWRIGIRKPRQSEEIFHNYILGLDKGSLATSGDYERYFMVDGIRYSHLLNPKTGYPAREMQSATIYAPSGLKADILSTAVFVLGWNEGKKLIEELPGIEGFLVREDEIWMSDGFKRLLLK